MVVGGEECPCPRFPPTGSGGRDVQENQVHVDVNRLRFSFCLTKKDMCVVKALVHTPPKKGVVG